MTAMSNSGTQTGGAWKKYPSVFNTRQGELAENCVQANFSMWIICILFSLQWNLMEFGKSFNWGHIHMGHLQNDGQIWPLSHLCSPPKLAYVIDHLASKTECHCVLNIIKIGRQLTSKEKSELLTSKVTRGHNFHHARRVLCWRPRSTDNRVL